jgi:hypothetical protein
MLNCEEERLTNKKKNELMMQSLKQYEEEAGIPAEEYKRRLLSREEINPPQKNYLEPNLVRLMTYLKVIRFPDEIINKDISQNGAPNNNLTHSN